MTEREYIYRLPQSKAQILRVKVDDIYEDLMAHPGMWTKVEFKPEERQQWWANDTFGGQGLLESRDHVQCRVVDGVEYYRYVIPPAKPTLPMKDPWGWLKGWPWIVYVAVFIIVVVPLVLALVL